MQKKSMCMYFSIDINKHCGLPVIYLGNCVCQFVKEVKYLGVMIHSSMKTTIDVARQTRKFYMQANLLRRNFRYCSDDVKCTLFQSYCTNMYCCQLWFNSTKSSLSNYPQAIIVCFVDFSVFLNHIVTVPCLFLEVFLPLLNLCVNLSIDLKTELSLVQTLSLQHVYHH